MEKPPCYRIIVSDIDETLIMSGQQLDPAHAKAVQKMRALGCTFVLASGRAIQRIMPVYRQLGLNEPIIASNGAHLIVPGEEPIIMSIPTLLAAEILNLADRQKITAISTGLNAIYVTGKYFWNKGAERFVRDEQIKVFYKSPFDIREEPLLNISLSAAKTDIDALSASLKKTYGEALTVFRFDDEQIEIRAAGVNKMTALKQLLQRYKVTANQVAAFGDADNDVELLSGVGLGIAMPHGTAHARFAAKVCASYTQGTDLIMAIMNDHRK